MYIGLLPAETLFQRQADDRAQKSIMFYRNALHRGDCHIKDFCGSAAPGRSLQCGFDLWSQVFQRNLSQELLLCREIAVSGPPGYVCGIGDFRY